MDINEKKEQNEQQALKKEANLTENTFGNRILNVIKTNKLSLFLVICLIVVFTWLTLQNSSQQKQFKQEKATLVKTHEIQMDSLRIAQITFATEVFSWSVRSELLRNNKENLNQLVTVFVQQSGADLVQIINATDNIVLLSSDKKFEGTPVADTTLASLSSTKVLREANTVTIMSPIMGFNDKLGVLLVNFRTITTNTDETKTQIKEN